MTWRLSIHDELPSTQDAVLAAAQAGERDRLAVLARRQSAGRGTQGRPWRSPQGNLFLSVLLRPAGPARELPQWSLLAGLAVAETLSVYLPDPAALRLKWPNDVLLEGAKAAGILTQGQPDAAGRIAWLVLGIGVNLAEAPALPDRVTACLAQHMARAPEPVAFAWALLARLDHWRARQEAEGFAPIRAAWMARGPALQAPLALQRPEGRIDGLYQGLTEDGRLLLCSKGGPIAVASGEIAG